MAVTSSEPLDGGGGTSFLGENRQRRKPIEMNSVLNAKKATLGIVAAAALGFGGWTAWSEWSAAAKDRLPAGIVSTNGRIEAATVDVASEVAGRVVDIAVREGDRVASGQEVARLDPLSARAEIERSGAEAERARQAVTVAEAMLAAQEAELTFARQEFDRTAALADLDVGSHRAHQQSQQALTAAEAGLASRTAGVAEAVAAVRAAEAALESARIALARTEIAAPVAGTVLYRLIETGAVIPAGGRIVTLLDLDDVTMTVFLPAGDAGRLVLGDEARVILDALPETVLPMTVSFVSPDAQFTPKTVETDAERERLMFRVELRAPADLDERLGGRPVSGLRGVAYLRTDPGAGWPERLATSDATAGAATE
ncbi:MAG: efflux transporter periplasmic adaptor subunit [Rhodobacter sp.]|nr:efflux transporter periplasmic adaptor subunit [Rhodobacter sp.]